MLAISTASFTGYGLDRTFALAAEAGLDGIEVAIRHSDFDSYDPLYLKALSKRHNLPIVAIAAPENVSPAKAEKTIEVALAVGAPLVTISPPDLFDFRYKKWIQNELRDLRKKKNIQLALTNAPAQTVLGILPKYSLNNTEELKSFPDVALDTSNAASHGEPLLEVYAALKQNIVHIYLSNAKSDQDHLLPTDGNLPLESLLTRLGRDKFAGAITLRVTPKALGVGKTDKVLANISKCQEFVKKYLQAE
jgi:sugar phosphate isomerase/epimerase